MLSRAKNHFLTNDDLYRHDWAGSYVDRGQMLRVCMRNFATVCRTVSEEIANRRLRQLSIYSSIGLKDDCLFCR